MLDEDKEIDSFEDDEDEIDFDDEPDEVVDSEPKDVPAEVERKEDTTAADIARERAEWQAEKERITGERDEADYRAKEATYHAASDYVNRCKNDVKKEGELLSDLEGQLEEARINGDADKAKSLTRNIGEKRAHISKLNGEITQYSPLLVKPERTVTRPAEVKPEQEKLNPVQVLANKWKKENSWYDDPSSKEKKVFADKLFRQLCEDGYDPESLGFWTHIDKEVKGFGVKEPEKRRTPPAVRPISSNGGSKQLTNKNRADADLKAKTYQMLERRGITKDDPNYEKIRKSYYNTAKEFAQKEKANG